MVEPVRCANHQGRVDLPRLCHICQRIDVERELVTRTVDAFLAAGYELQTNYGEGLLPDVATKDRAVILKELMEVDDEYLIVTQVNEAGGARVSWVRFVYGNDGYDVISDYTTDLEAIIAPIMAHAETLS